MKKFFLPLLITLSLFIGCSPINLESEGASVKVILPGSQNAKNVVENANTQDEVYKYEVRLIGDNGQSYKQYGERGSTIVFSAVVIGTYQVEVYALDANMTSIACAYDSVEVEQDKTAEVNAELELTQKSAFFVNTQFGAWTLNYNEYYPSSKYYAARSEVDFSVKTKEINGNSQQVPTVKIINSNTDYVALVRDEKIAINFTTIFTLGILAEKECDVVLAYQDYFKEYLPTIQQVHLTAGLNSDIGMEVWGSSMVGMFSVYIPREAGECSIYDYDTTTVEIYGDVMQRLTSVPYERKVVDVNYSAKASTSTFNFNLNKANEMGVSKPQAGFARIPFGKGELTPIEISVKSNVTDTPVEISAVTLGMTEKENGVPLFESKWIGTLQDDYSEINLLLPPVLPSDDEDVGYGSVLFSSQKSANLTVQVFDQKEPVHHRGTEVTPYYYPATIGLTDLVENDPPVNYVPRKMDVSTEPANAYTSFNLKPGEEKKFQILAISMSDDFTGTVYNTQFDWKSYCVFRKYVAPTGIVAQNISVRHDSQGNICVKNIGRLDYVVRIDFGEDLVVRFTDAYPRMRIEPVIISRRVITENNGTRIISARMSDIAEDGKSFTSHCVVRLQGYFNQKFDKVRVNVVDINTGRCVDNTGPKEVQVTDWRPEDVNSSGKILGLGNEVSFNKDINVDISAVEIQIDFVGLEDSSKPLVGEDIKLEVVIDED